MNWYASTHKIYHSLEQQKENYERARIQQFEATSKLHEVIGEREKVVETAKREKERTEAELKKMMAELNKLNAEITLLQKVVADKDKTLKENESQIMRTKEFEVHIENLKSVSDVLT